MFCHFLLPIFINSSSVNFYYCSSIVFLMLSMKKAKAYEYFFGLSEFIAFRYLALAYLISLRSGEFGLSLSFSKTSSGLSS